MEEEAPTALAVVILEPNVNTDGVAPDACEPAGVAPEEEDEAAPPKTNSAVGPGAGAATLGMVEGAPKMKLGIAEVAGAGVGVGILVTTGATALVTVAGVAAVIPSVADNVGTGTVSAWVVVAVEDAAVEEETGPAVAVELGVEVDTGGAVEASEEVAFMPNMNLGAGAAGAGTVVAGAVAEAPRARAGIAAGGVAEARSAVKLKRGAVLGAGTELVLGAVAVVDPSSWKVTLGLLIDLVRREANLSGKGSSNYCMRSGKTILTICRRKTVVSSFLLRARSV